MLVDAHLDLAWNALDWNRDLSLPVEAIRRREKDLGVQGKGRGVSTVSLPALRQGGFGLVVATLLARLHRSDLVPGLQRYESMPGAHGAARGQLAWYEAMCRRGAMRMICYQHQLATHEGLWAGPGGPEREPIGFILSMEGADPVLFPDEVDLWWGLGLRVIGPAHYGPSTYANGTGCTGGFFPPGRDLLKAMRRLGMILDVTHLADEAFDQAMEWFDGPVLASHHNCRALVDDQRQLSDEQIKKLLGRDAVIGAAFDAWMLVPGWVRGQTTPAGAGVTMEHVADHIDHICQMAGNARQVSLGTDLDGGFGTEQGPLDVDTIADVRNLRGILGKRGYSDADLDGIMGGNWLRFFRKNLPSK